MIKKTIFVILFSLLIYTRFVGLNWGLPYPMHPDERNMANAIQSLNCKISNFEFRISNFRECGNPHFYAYGQFSLYLGYIMIQGYHMLTRQFGQPINFIEAVMSLRIISAAASIINVIVLLKILSLLINNLKIKIQNSKSQLPPTPRLRWASKNKKFVTFSFLLLIFSPYGIQFSHFGTTESLLMLFYSLIIYQSLKLITDQGEGFRRMFFLSFFSGLALATKISSVVFLAVPLVGIMSKVKSQNAKAHVKSKKFYFDFLFVILNFAFLVLTFTFIFSPHNFISFNEFLGSLRYESDVALGRIIVFYTRQFVGTVPVIFQTVKIFPYVLGWPQFIMAVLGFIFLPWRNINKSQLNLLRFAFLIYFLPNAFIFAKWTRFMSPILPIMSIFSILFLFYSLQTFYHWISSKFTFNFLAVILNFAFCLLTLLPGIAYLAVFQTPDIRFQASDWVYKNIPENAKILSETANVIDIPVPSPGSNPQPRGYQYVSFYFYDLDASTELQNQLQKYIGEADYIFVPSRRIFANHPKQQYPLLEDYYQKLFTGKLGFEEIAKFTSYPRISLFGHTLIEFPDENSEESWTVFDHPVIRIYKKFPISNSPREAGFQFPNDSQISNNQFQNYQLTAFRLGANTYRLLVADTPEKWEKGLMYVRSKTDTRGMDGMIFIFPDLESRTFWNKNTLVNLDLYWLSEDKVVGKSYLPSIEKSGKVMTVNSPDKVNQVIEIISGSF